MDILYEEVLDLDNCSCVVFVLFIGWVKFVYYYVNLKVNCRVVWEKVFLWKKIIFDVLVE